MIEIVLNFAVFIKYRIFYLSWLFDQQILIEILIDTLSISDVFIKIC